MAGYIFLGRRRQPWKLILFQLLTLGIYGRVYLYKILREFDGHEALFLDRRPYIPLLILPFVGPLLVKRKITRLADDLVHHDVTTPKFRPRRLNLLAWVPLAPLYHLELQRVLNHHWGMHSKEVELELKRNQLASLQRSRNPDSVKAAQALSKEIVLREKELEDVRQAALALREAEMMRMQAERQAGRRKSPMALVRKLSAAAAARLPKKRADAALEEEEAMPEAAPEPVRKGRKPEPEPEPEPVPTEEEPSEERESKDAHPEEATAEEDVPKKNWRSFLPFGKKDEKAAPEKPVKKPKASKGGKSEEDDAEKDLSRAERKELKRKEKEKKKAAKLAAKEKKRADKAAAKEEKRAAKEAAKAEKAKAKEEAKAAKEKEKAAAKKKDAGKKEKKAGKPSTKGKATKPKGRSK